MAGSKQEGPMCQATRPVRVDDGTLCRLPSPSPGPIGVPAGSYARPIALQSEEIHAAGDAVTANVALLSYDAFVRKYVYEPASAAISEQGEEFVRRNLMSRAKAAEWVNAQRNSLLINVRDSRNSPLGRAISEYLKPRDTLPNVADLAGKIKAKVPGATQEEVFAAIIRSGARTRGSVNKLAVALRWGGPVLVAVNIGVSAYLVFEAPPDQQGRVAAREAGGLLGGFGGGWAGAEAGCAGGAAVGVWFEGIGAVPGCAVGAVFGGFGLGWAGSEAGLRMGEEAFDFTQTFIEWVNE